MNKNKFVLMLIVCAVSAIFFTVIFAQFKTVEETDLTGIRTAREEEPGCKETGLRTGC